MSAQELIAKSTPEEFAKITARGRLLAEYDVAAWHATDAVQALKPEDGEVGRYIAQKTDSGWIVAFGKLNAARDVFLIAYLAKQGSSPEAFTVTRSKSPLEDRSFFLAAALAIDGALSVFKAQSRPYNVSVLPDSSGHLLVYVVPAQTNIKVYPYGGDMRFEFSADGRNLLAKRELHRTILEFRPDPDKQTATVFHTHFLDDVPGDTDVFYVLSRKPLVPEMIATKGFLYSVEIDGTIHIVEKTGKKK